MKDKKVEEIIQEIRKISEISNLNFLLGAGASSPFIPTKPDIEKNINKAMNENKVSDLVDLRKGFFSEVMKPCLKIKDYDHDREKNSKLSSTYSNYQSLFAQTVEYLITRKSTLLDKQVNLFTSNIDIFMEKVLEDMNIYYNDGFVGQISPSFSTSNFRTIIKNKSERFGKYSEIPTFNLYKIHGSLTWKLEDSNNISYSDLSFLENIEKAKKENDNEEFNDLYSKLQIINPNQEKFKSTVLRRTFYELLRLYTTALEEENSLLFVIGFSFRDEHILEMTKRAINSNPTLTIIIFSYSVDEVNEFKRKFNDVRYKNNIKIINPSDYDVDNIDVGWIANNFISKLKRDINTQT